MKERASNVVRLLVADGIAPDLLLARPVIPADAPARAAGEGSEMERRVSFASYRTAHDASGSEWIGRALLGTRRSQLPVKRKICMLGAEAVGKTSLVRRFVSGIYSEHAI